MTHHARAAAVLGVLALAGGCALQEPYVRDNHWDPRSSATKSLSGPDSVFAMGDTFRVTLQADPPLPPGAFYTWRGNEMYEGPPPPTLVYPAGDGLFRVVSSTATFEVIAVSALFDGVAVSRQVRVGQRVQSYTFSCGVACDALTWQAGTSRSVSVLAADANQVPIRRIEVAMQRGSWLSRDPAVASVAATTANPAGTITISAVAAGTTWIVVRLDRAVDSLRVVVP